MGFGVECKADFAAIERMFEGLTSGRGAGDVVAEAVRAATEKHIRKDSGQLALSAEAGNWRVSYPKAYAETVWDVPPQIVSPRNPKPLAMANPHTHPDVVSEAAAQLALYAARLS